MSRVLAIDYGSKRVGIAVSDPLRIIAQPLATVATKECLDFLDNYLAENEVDTIVVGMPTQMNGEPSDSQRYILPFIGRLKKRFEGIEIATIEEAGTSVEAFEAMLQGGVSKSKRKQSAGVVDKTAASLILQRFLQ